jgi:hypothetical protein
MSAYPLFPRWTEEDDDQMRTLAQSGISAAAIAEWLNRSKAAVRKRARGLGLTFRMVTVRKLDRRLI